MMWQDVGLDYNDFTIVMYFSFRQFYSGNIFRIKWVKCFKWITVDIYVCFLASYLWTEETVESKFKVLFKQCKLMCVAFFKLTL